MPSTLGHIVVVGANVAGLRAAEALRAEGFDGSITLINGEEELPYDRPPLSKQVLTGEMSPDEAVFRGHEHYRDLKLDLLSGKRASSLDLREQSISVGSGPIYFDGLIIACGASPRMIRGLEVSDLDGIYVIRTLDDAKRIRSAFEGNPRVVIIGAGFIGSEVASSARKVGLRVTIVEALSTPLGRALGSELGAVCANLHRENGTDLRCGAIVEAVEGDGRVERVRLSDGTSIEADIVVVGIGVVPNVGWLEGSGLTIANGLVCDETLNTGHPTVYAAGDVACWPNPLFGVSMRCEHWTNSAEQGRLAARNLLKGHENGRAYTGSCYFWSDQYGVRIQFAGTPTNEFQVVSGSVDEHKFVAFYRSRDRIVGALGVDSPKLLMKAKMMIEKGEAWETALAAVDQ